MTKRIYATIKDGLKRIWRKTTTALALVLLLFFLCAGIVYIPSWQVGPPGYIHFATEKERIELEDQLRRTILQILGGVVVLIGLYLTYRRIKASEKQVEAFKQQVEIQGFQVDALREQVRTQGHQVDAFRHQVTVTREGQITERFTRAVEQLGNENIHIRLGGIFALERLANDSDRDHGIIMEILAAFIRERGPVKIADDTPISDDKPGKLIDLGEDIYAALTVIGRRKIIEGEDPPNLANTNFRRAKLQRLKLSGAILNDAIFSGADLQVLDLRRSILYRANLEEADLQVANLQWASLHGANIQRAQLLQTDLQWASLPLADLRGALLLGANLREANLWRVNFRGTNLIGANLEKAHLVEADLRGADLKGAELKEAKIEGANLRGAALQKAKNITAIQLSQVETLFEATIDLELEIGLRETHPHLFEEPKKDEEEDDEEDYEETE